MARRQVSIFINGREVANQIKPLRAEKRKIVRELERMTVGTSAYNKKVKELDRVNGVLTKHNQKIRGTSKAWGQAGNSIKTFAGLAAAKISADAIVAFGKEMLVTGTALEAIENNARIIFEDSLPKVEAASKKNAAQMGLTNSQYKDFASNIADVLKPMGFFPDEAANMSTATINLSGALAEWTKGRKTSAEVSDILKSALTGERESLKQLGIVISEADIKARLADKGISGLTGKLLEQAKAAATLELITEKSLDAQTAFAANSGSMARQQAELTAKLTNVKETVAEALIPVFNRLLELSMPVVDVFSDLVSVLTSGEKSTSKFSGIVNIMATVVTNAGKALGFLWEVTKGLTGFFLRVAGPAIDFIGSNIIRLFNVSVKAVNGLKEFLNLDVGDLKPINVDDFKKSLAEATEALNKSEVKKPIEVPIKAVSGSDKDVDLQAEARKEAAKKAAQRERERRKKEDEREQKALQKQYERLLEISEKFREESRLNRLKDEDKEIAELEAKFQEQIDKARELEIKKVAGSTELILDLENQKAQAISALKEEHRLKEEEKRKEFLEELKLEVATDLEAELLQLDDHYLALIEKAELYEIDVSELKRQWSERRKEVEEEFRQKEIATQKKSNQEKLKQDQDMARAQADLQLAKISLARTIGNQLAGIAGENAALQTSLFLFDKTLAVAEVLINLQKQLSAIRLKYALIPGGAVLAAVESSQARIAAGISLATIAGTAIQKFTQKKEGGWHRVKGDDDGKTYHAQYIGSPNTGMLPSHPVVLASEAGPEYFVDNQSLRNPAVLQYVQAIENIKSARQFVEGGFNATGGPSSPSTSTATDAAQPFSDPRIIQVLSRLADSLDNGIFAILDDDTLVDIPKKLEELNNGSGGVLL